MMTIAACLLLVSAVLPAGPFGFAWALQDASEEASSSQQTQAVQAIPAYRQANEFVIIPISGAIDMVTVRSVERRLQYAVDAQAQAAVFELDTPGGLAVAALEICELIKGTSIPLTVAWVHSDAYSAGTLIALACDEIVMAPFSDMGDCAPIIPWRNLEDAERAKAESPLLAEVVDSARRHGYDEKLAMSFIAHDIELWLIENVETGDQVFVDRIEYETVFGEAPPESARKRASGGSSPTGHQPTTGRILPYLERRPGSPGGTGAAPTEGNVPTPAERDAEVEMQQSLPSPRPELTTADRGKYRLLETVVDDKTLLTVKREQAERYALSKGVISSDEELKAYFGAQGYVRYEASWSEGLVVILTSLPVRIALVLIFAIGLLWEMSTPGMGVPAGMALVALLVLLGAPALTGMAQWWDIALVLAGIVLIAAELFVIPGFGIAGVSGLICLGIGFVGTFVAPDPSGGILPASASARDALARGSGVMVLCGFAVVVLGYYMSQYIGHIPLFGKLVLTESVRDFAEPQTVLGAMAATGSAGGLPATGEPGTALTALRPIGRARIAGNVYDVVANHGSIEAGAPLRVVESSKFRIVVEADGHHG